MIVRSVTSFAARAALFMILLVVATICHLSAVVRSLFGGRRVSTRPRRLLLMGTFYNRGWFRSHVLPLCHCEALDEVIVVCDQRLFDLPKVRYLCPPRRLVRWTGRSLARFLWMLHVTWKQRPEVLMGYHIMPNSLFCLVASRIFGGRAIYQMTGGPIQLIGGGPGSENALLRRLGKPSRILEAMLFHVVRQFDIVIVRGESARTFVWEHELSRRCEIVTGSVDVRRFSPGPPERDYDIVYVSRLVPCKGLEHWLEVLAQVVKRRPSIRVAMLGDGPLREELQEQADRLGIAANVDFLGKVDRVDEVLKRARLFALVSPSEGMSIAMLEAMGAGLPAVVTDVGDLRDMVEPGVTGLLVDHAKLHDTADAVLTLLEDEPLRVRISDAARAAVVDRCSVEAIARRWDEMLERNHASRTHHGTAASQPELAGTARSSR